MSGFPTIADLYAVDDDGENLAYCDYYEGVGSCSFGCYDEPECFTCEPRGGWPAIERHPYAEFLLAARRLSYRTQNWIGWGWFRKEMAARREEVTA